MIKILGRNLLSLKTTFPDLVLVMLGMMLLSMVLWWLARLGNVGPAWLQIVGFAAALNLLVFPFAGLVVIIRRRGNVESA
jgi:hypothetical protein